MGPDLHSSTTVQQPGRRAAAAAAVGEGAEDLAAEGETGGVDRTCVVACSYGERATGRPGQNQLPKVTGPKEELFFNKAFGSASREAEAGAGAVLGAVP